MMMLCRYEVERFMGYCMGDNSQLEIFEGVFLNIPPEELVRAFDALKETRWLRISRELGLSKKMTRLLRRLYGE